MVAQPYNVALQLQRIERMHAHRRYERQEVEKIAEPDHAPALGESDAAAQLFLGKRPLSLETELDGLHFGLLADQGERVLCSNRTGN
jgi:hypothetical protein